MAKEFNVEVKYHRTFNEWLAILFAGWASPVPNEKRIGTIVHNMGRQGYQLRDRYDDPIRRVTTLKFYSKE